MTEIKKGTIMCQVKLATDKPVDLTSVMTLDSLDELGLKKGDQVTVVIKSTEVMLQKN